MEREEHPQETGLQNEITVNIGTIPNGHVTILNKRDNLAREVVGQVSLVGSETRGELLSLSLSLSESLSLFTWI